MLSLVADYDTTSSSSIDGNDSDNNKDESESVKNNSASANSPHALLLPSANVLLSRESSKLTGDVFNNQFLEAERLEIAKLQKHVKMVDSEEHLLQKNGRKICWNNRKGRCRFGNKCKYAHDSDLVESKDYSNADQQILNKKFKISPHTLNAASLDMESDYTEKGKTTKRSGLGDSIVPGKRVMKSYHKMKKTT